MDVTLVSPYHGGSHRSWAEGYKRFSRHAVQLLTLPARFWKWRMHGGAVTLARRFVNNQRAASTFPPDVIFATDMLDLTTFLALIGRTCPHIPVALYMHENQLTYPLPDDPGEGPMRRQKGERDLHYAFINYASMLAADRVLFNSRFHRDSLLDALPRFLRHFPEYNEIESVYSLREKSTVLPVGLDLQSLGEPHEFSPPETPSLPEPPSPPLVLWNQRWEYDKNPSAFFRALYSLHDESVPFRLALCGERFRHYPQEFEEACDRLHERLIHVGYAKEDEYRRLLWAADVVVSTAVHEFFGISILEAIYCHTFPILPARLSYPDLLPERFHAICLYEEEEALLQRLRWALQNPQQTAELARELAPTVQQYSWQRIAQDYDSYLAALK